VFRFSDVILGAFVVIANLIRKGSYGVDLKQQLSIFFKVRQALPGAFVRVDEEVGANSQ
jgi:hypothetical protein